MRPAGAERNGERRGGANNELNHEGRRARSLPLPSPGGRGWRLARGNNPSPCPLPGGEGGINHEGQEHEILGLRIGIWNGRKKSQRARAGNKGIEPRMADRTDGEGFGHSRKPVHHHDQQPAAGGMRQAFGRRAHRWRDSGSFPSPRPNDCHYRAELPPQRLR